MARSQILKDLVNEKSSLESVLLRLKVIVSDLNDEKLINWVNCELCGYKENDILPNYRIIKGQVKANIVEGLPNKNGINKNVEGTLKTILSNKNKLIDNYIMEDLAHANSNIGFENLFSKDTYNNFITIELKNCIKTLESIDFNKCIGHSLDVKTCNLISILYRTRITNITRSIRNPRKIVNIKIFANHTQTSEIISKIKTKLVDIIKELEKEFDDIDSLDIKSSLENKSADEKYNIILNINKMVFGDSINIGDNNKITKSSISNNKEGGKECWLKKILK